MAAAIIRSKGRITIPASVREALGLNAGDRLEFVADGENRCALIAIKGSIAALKGMLKKPDRPVSIEDMNEAIAESGSRE